MRMEDSMSGEQTMRIECHPVLGLCQDQDRVTIIVDGVPIKARRNEPIAAAIAASGTRVHRYTERVGEPRGIFCAIGQCTDCSMEVDGVPGVRTCITPVREGMIVVTPGHAERGAAGFEPD